jgi:hypothetical protein
MRAILRCARRWLAIAVVLAAATAEHRACGQNPVRLPRQPAPIIVVPDLDKPPDPARGEEAEEMAPPAARRAQRNPKVDAARLLHEQMRQMYKMQFDVWCRNRIGDQIELERRLQGRLDSRIDDCRRELRLSDAQVKKLELAGRGDVKRLLDRLRAIERTLDDPDSTTEELAATRGEMAEIESARTGEPFGPQSLFSKTLLSNLTPEQKALRQRVLTERVRLRYQLAIERGVRVLRENLGLNDRQVQQLETLLRSGTRAPRRYGQAPDVALVLFQLSRLPTDQVRPSFDDDQWRTVSKWMSAYTTEPRAKNVLERHGFVFEADSPSEPPAPVGTAREGTKPRG